MEPFAATPKRGLQLHWWITAAAAGAFFIWSFDLIPRIKSAAGGKIAESGTAGSASDIELDPLDWPELDGDPDAEPPELSELVGIDDADPIGRAPARIRPRNDRGVTRADWSLDEPAAAEVPDPDSGLSGSGIAQASYDTDHSPSVPTDQRATEELVLPADVAKQLRDANTALQDGRVLDAHAILSAVYWKVPEFRPLFQEQIDSTAAMIFTSAEQHFAEPHFVEFGETLDSIAQQYGVPWQYLARLNRVSPEQLQAGQQLKVVRGPFGAVVDLSRFTLTVHAHGWYVNRYAIGIGRDQKTPVGEFVVENKLENPVWYNPDGGIVDADDPQNPLGEYWIGLGNHIGIHGTIDPDSIGRAASRGCVHLGDDDIGEVFALLSPGSKVTIRK